MSLVKKIKAKKKRKQRLANLPILLLAFLVVLTFLLGYKFKGLLVAATVNGKPIFSWQYGRHLWNQFGSRALDELVMEQLVIQEAKNLKVTITDEEAQAEIERIKDQLGGQAELENALDVQGLSLAEFQNNLRLQLQMDKLLAKNISITDKEIEVFITQYQLQMEATEEASLKDEARELLKSQKMAEAYETFFPELKEKSKINKFIKF